MAKNKNVAKVESNPKQVETSKYVDDEKVKRAQKRAAKQQAAKQVPMLLQTFIGWKWWWRRL